MDARRNNRAAPVEEGNVVVTRLFDAPRELVFAAWSSAEHLKHWFGPSGFAVTYCTVDFRVGGLWRACQRAPSGKEYWAQGVFREIAAPERLVFTDTLLGQAEKPRFEMLTTVTFEKAGRSRTKVVLQASVLEIFDPSSAPLVAGMGETWRQTIERLALHIADPKSDKS